MPFPRPITLESQRQKVTCMNSRVVERSILHYTNQERRKRKLALLRGHPALIRSSRLHSQWMARRRAFSHTGSGGSSPWDRATRAGYPSSTVSENIWQTQGQRGLAWKSKFRWDSDWNLGRAAVISWMNSPGHRANLLSPEWRHMGIGVARNNRDRIYLTQNFGGSPVSTATFTGRALFKLGATIAVVVAIAAIGTICVN